MPNAVHKLSFRHLSILRLLESSLHTSDLSLVRMAPDHHLTSLTILCRIGSSREVDVVAISLTLGLVELHWLTILNCSVLTLHLIHGCLHFLHNFRRHSVHPAFLLVSLCALLLPVVEDPIEQLVVLLGTLSNWHVVDHEASFSVIAPEWNHFLLLAFDTLHA